MCFEELLVMHASPTLANLKPASLISMNNTAQGKECLKKLEKRGLMFFQLNNSKGQSLLLVYRKDKLEQVLSAPRAEEILKHFGYPESLEERLAFLKKRFQSTQCPHEVGIFLGYPPDDVKGFIENAGKKYLMIGYWKVYSDLAGARTAFMEYDRAKDRAVNEFLTGKSIREIAL